MRNAQQIADDADRNRRREVVDEIDLRVSRSSPRAMPSTSLTRPGSIGGDVPLADGADDRAPDARVQRRIVEDQARRAVLEERRRAEFRAELFFLVRAEEP